MKLTKTGKIALGVFVILLANGIWQHIQFRKKWNATYEYLKADREEGAEQIWQRNEQQKRADQAKYEEHMKLLTVPEWGNDQEDPIPTTKKTGNKTSNSFKYISINYKF